MIIWDGKNPWDSVGLFGWRGLGSFQILLEPLVGGPEELRFFHILGQKNRKKPKTFNESSRSLRPPNPALMAIRAIKDQFNQENCHICLHHHPKKRYESCFFIKLYHNLSMDLFIMTTSITGPFFLKQLRFFSCCSFFLFLVRIDPPQWDLDKTHPSWARLRVDHPTLASVEYTPRGSCEPQKKKRGASLLLLLLLLLLSAATSPLNPVLILVKSRGF